MVPKTTQKCGNTGSPCFRTKGGGGGGATGLNAAKPRHRLSKLSSKAPLGAVINLRPCLRVRGQSRSADVTDTSLEVHLREDSDSEGFRTDVRKKRRRERREGNQDEA